MECSNECLSKIKCVVSIIKSIAQIFLIYFLYLAYCSYEKSNDAYIKWSNLYIAQFKQNHDSTTGTPNNGSKIDKPEGGPGRFSTTIESTKDSSSLLNHPSR